MRKELELENEDEMEGTEPWEPQFYTSILSYLDTHENHRICDLSPISHKTSGEKLTRVFGVSNSDSKQGQADQKVMGYTTTRQQIARFTLDIVTFSLQDSVWRQFYFEKSARFLGGCLVATSLRHNSYKDWLSSFSGQTIAQTQDYWILEQGLVFSILPEYH